MTQKELLYVEDAIGHEQNIIKICEESLEYISDDSLTKFLNKELGEHKDMLEQLINILEVKENE